MTSYQRPDPRLRIADKVEGRDDVMAIYAPGHVIAIKLAVPYCTRREQGEVLCLCLYIHIHPYLYL